MTGNAAIDAAVGRTAFGVGAVIIWLCTAAVIAFGHPQAVRPKHTARRLAPARKRLTV
jgi:hypothetical protein